MSQNNQAKPSKRFGKKLLFLAPLGIVVFGVCFVIYINIAFPEARVATVTHLESPEDVSDCFECHIKATPKIGQDWYESKHGVILVKCFVCHGPDPLKKQLVRLDSWEGATRDLGGYRAIDPADPEKSDFHISDER